MKAGSALVLCVILGLALHAVAKGTISKAKELEMAQSKQIKGRFDWNHQTVGQMMPVAKPFGLGQIAAPRTTWRGVTGLVTDALTVFPGGHNFATRRAVDYAIAKVTNDNAKSAKLLKMMKAASIADLLKDKNDQAFAVYSLLYGNFQNELRVNLDGDVGVYAAAAAGIRLRFGGDKEISPDGKNSKFFTPETGYSSANPIHSMLASTSDEKKNAETWTQDKSLLILKNFVTESLTEAITLLRAEKAREDAEASSKTGILGSIGKSLVNGWNAAGSYVQGNGGYAPGWAKAMRLIGSVLHTVQDSACGCTPKHWAIKSTADCLAGDGHGVIEYFPDEKRFKVTGLSDAIFYKERLHFHEELDKLYEEGRVLPIATLAASTNEQIDAITANNLFGSFDPAIAGGKIILDVVTAVYDRPLPPPRLPPRS